ncbi:Uma2 family endonuclease [Streptomyces sp. JJ66]|uniref:Uma2 family endonuclease n=1 Tax=Streptomyces sp. JJ66 TaxID=2803843 RepID=UPI00214B4898|nr:Uma2 family endonuclease [Streptomyces sp. JJ66]
MLDQPTATEELSAEEYTLLLRTAEELDTPEGFKAELIGGKIVVSPWTHPSYMRAMRLLRQRFQEHAPQGHIADTSPFLFTFPTARRAYGPDVYVAEEHAFDEEVRHVDGEALSLVAELTSRSTRDADWRDKLVTYGRHVPVYLLVDMQVRQATAFWEPSEHGYRSRHTVSFGEPLYVPEPFGFELETTGFARAEGAR